MAFPWLPPHRDEHHLIQSVTSRLADSLPQTKLRQLESQLEQLPVTERDIAKRDQIESWLDSGIGCCALRHPDVAAIVQDTSLRFDGDRYTLIAWCIMPNHVHTLIKPIAPLAGIVQSWKSFTGRWAMARNAELGLGVPRDQKSFWMREYWDRYMRDGKHLRRVIDYIHQNPVKANLCQSPNEWRWSSASPPLGTPSPLVLRSFSEGGSSAPPAKK